MGWWSTNILGGDSPLDWKASLYNKLDFKKHKLDLKFLFSDQITYKQYSDRFLPWLSIIDILMFNETTTIKKFLQQFTLQ